MSAQIRLVTGQDIEMIQQWYSARGVEVPSANSLPEIGYIVGDIAAGFIYQTDSSICMLDGYITNPTRIGSLRDEAIEAITYKLLTEAVTRGFTEVLALSRAPRIKDKALNWKFENGGEYTLFHRTLG